MNSPLAYTIQLPENMEPGKKYPVIYAMHGMGSNEKDILKLLEGLKEDFILIGIRGPLPYGDGFSYFYIKSFGNPERELFEQSVTQLQEFFEYAAQSYPINSSRQYLLGFSQGAILAMTLALVLGDKIKGIVAMNGYIPTFVTGEYSIQSTLQTSIFISHGEFDPIFPVNIGRANYDFFQQRSQSVQFKTYPIGHEVSADNLNDLVTWIYQDAQVNENLNL